MSERQRYYGQSRSDFDRLIERWVAHYANAAVLSQLNATDSFSQGRFGLNYSVEAPAYGQLKAGGRLMVFKPVLLGRREGVFLTAPNRKYPVLLNAAAFRESIRVRLPATFRADELPDPEKLESPFGRYEAKCEVQNGELACSRMWEIRAATVPPQQYQAVQQFYEKILAQEQAAVVLERKLGQ
jgi:hypothetical protein